MAGWNRTLRQNAGRFGFFPIADIVTSLLQWSLYCLQELTNFATLTASK